MGSRGQKQLLNAALARRSRQQHEQQARSSVSEVTLVSNNEEIEVVAPNANELDRLDHEPIAGPMAVNEKHEDHNLNAKLAEANLIPPNKKTTEIKDNEDRSAKVGPRTDLPQNLPRVKEQKFKGNFLEMEALSSNLKEIFSKVQIGEGSVVLTNPTFSVESEEEVVDQVNSIFKKHGVDVSVSKGSREGRYRAVAL